MDIKISHNWLKEYLQTNASVKEIGDKLALSGPSVEKIEKVKNDYIYDTEVTANRVDCMSILGIAREASAILPNAKLKREKNKQSLHGYAGKNTKDLLKIKIDPKFVNRVMAVVMEVKIGKSPQIIKDRLESADMRSLNNLVDVTNYVMQEIGHPTHVFDFDLIPDGILNFRLSQKGETIITLDDRTYELLGDDIVIEDINRNIIDLPGIMGTKNSVVNNNTKRIIFFIDNIDKQKLRKTSTRLGIRTNAAILNEKGVDPELAAIAFEKGIELYKKIADAKTISRIYDIYPRIYKQKLVKLNHSFIEKKIGIKIPNKKVVEILEKLGFEVKVKGNEVSKACDDYVIKVPSWRANDVTIPEDIVEEVARIYGYYNLPSEIMSGKLPAPITNTDFDFVNKIKEILKSHGGFEIYTNSLVSKEMAGETALKLKNPLGGDAEYLRTSLKPSLINAVKENKKFYHETTNSAYLFEVANVYLRKDPSAALRVTALPKENMTLAAIFANYEYRKAKGIVEALYKELHINEKFNLEILNDTEFYFEIDIETLKKNYKDFAKFVPISKYPSQIEDVTFEFLSNVKVGEIIGEIKKVENVENVELKEIYKNNFTFRIWYHDNEKTLSDADVNKIREKIIWEVNSKFGGSVKN
ncbi:MAG TPA: phenylalanine--tRNA ligase subunit beta [Patescibacteria group bacterium]|nr:phenylalanine--tRNA ligase subunit beta [Patescibacteria group bacterium]